VSLLHLKIAAKLNNRSAGVRDSVLTNHGVQQANRLGQYFAKFGISFTNIFSSDLSRAIKTAEAIRTAQTPVDDELLTVQIPELREQDFGFYEGKPFYARRTESTKSGKEAHDDKHKNEPGFQDIESREAMAKRVNTFLDGHLLPLLHKSPIGEELTVAIVSHGILLSSLWRCLLRRQLPNTVSINAELLANQRFVSLEHLGGWSNTGYLELELRKVGIAVTGEFVSHTLGGEIAQEFEATLNPGCSFTSDADSAGLSEKSVGPCFTVVIKIVDGREHLKGLKRTGGGVGSSKFEEGQKSIKSFFKKQRTGAHLASCTSNIESLCSCQITDRKKAAAIYLRDPQVVISRQMATPR